MSEQAHVKLEGVNAMNATHFVFQRQVHQVRKSHEDEVSIPGRTPVQYICELLPWRGAWCVIEHPPLGLRGADRQPVGEGNRELRCIHMI